MKTKYLGKALLAVCKKIFFSIKTIIIRFEGYDAKEHRFIAIKKIELDKID